MALITSIQANGFVYEVLPSGLQFLDNTLILSVEHVTGDVNARLSFNFQSGQWSIDRISYSGKPNELTADILSNEIEQIFDKSPALYVEGTKLVELILAMNELDDEAFEAASQRGEFDNIPFSHSNK